MLQSVNSGPVKLMKPLLEIIVKYIYSDGRLKSPAFIPPALYQTHTESKVFYFILKSISSFVGQKFRIKENLPWSFINTFSRTLKGERGISAPRPPLYTHTPQGKSAMNKSNPREISIWFRWSPRRSPNIGFVVTHAHPTPPPPN